MSTRASQGCFRSALTGALLYGAGALFAIVCAQPVQEAAGSARNLGTQVGAGPVFDITGGTRPAGGPNLFHSFSAFGLSQGQTANFLNNSGLTTSNIFSRVTGGTRSEIHGTIQTTGFLGANLYLMNPAGILFGPTAQLNVEGSFHATTANSIKFADGTTFAVDTPAGALTSAPPSAFGFLAGNPASIDVLVGGTDSSFTARRLEVPEGQTLSLVGGTLNLGAAEIRDGSGAIVQEARPASLFAPGGRINLVSVGAGAAERQVSLDGAGGFNVDGVGQLGDINIRGGRVILDFGDGSGPAEFLSASVIDAKEIFIRGGKLEMSDGLINPGYFSLVACCYPSPDGGAVDIQITGSATITATDRDVLSFRIPGIYTTAGAFFEPQLFPDAKVPDITIKAGSLTLSGIAAIQTDRLGPGEPAKVLVEADTVTVQNGASIVSLNFYDGPGGNIEINAREVNLSGDGTVSETGITGLSAQNLIHPCFLCVQDPDTLKFIVDSRLTSASSGSIMIGTKTPSENVRVSGNALIVTDNLAFGRSGDITIKTGNLIVAGAGAESAAIKAQTAFVGDAGTIKIEASGTVELQNGGQIAGSTVGAGTGGNIDVSAGKAITLTGADSRIVNATGPASVEQLNEIFTVAFQPGNSFEEVRDRLGLPANASIFDVLGTFLSDMVGFGPLPPLTPGNAGTIVANTPLLTLNANTRIEMSTGWDGNAGELTATVGSLFVNDAARISSRSGLELLSGEALVGPGNAGAINITATDTISVSGAGSSISTTTFGDGNGGNVELNAGNRVSITNGGAVRSDSGGTLGGSVLSGTGLAGNITITAGNEIVFDKGQVTTQTLTADGGNITLIAPQIVRLENSTISTSVQGSLGAGGNILIDPQFVIVNNSSIIANAFGGPGGNITIIAENFLQSATSVITASSALSTPGVIEVRSPENNVENNIAQLPAAFIDASALLRGLCTARRTGAPSSFVVAGRGGVPVDADGYLPSFGTDVAAGVASTSGSTHVDAQRINQPVLAVALLLPNELDCLR